MCRCSSPHLVVRHQISCQDSSTVFVVVSHPASHARPRPAPRIATRLTGSLFWVRAVSDAPRGLSSTPPHGRARLVSRLSVPAQHHRQPTFHLRPSNPPWPTLVRLWRCCRDHESGLEADFTQALSGCAHHLRPRPSSARLFWVLHPPASVGRLLCLRVEEDRNSNGQTPRSARPRQKWVSICRAGCCGEGHQEETSKLSKGGR